MADADSLYEPNSDLDQDQSAIDADGEEDDAPADRYAHQIRENFIKNWIFGVLLGLSHDKLYRSESADSAQAGTHDDHGRTHKIIH